MVQEVSLTKCRTTLKKHTNASRAIKCPMFFKNSKEDEFLGIDAATIRKIAKEFQHLSLSDVLILMKSKVHDEHSVANAILRLKFRKGDERERTHIFNFYVKNRQYIRDWDAVDDSAPYIVGAYLLERDKELLYQLAQSKRIWCRRIAIVSTWWFIRNHKIDDTLKISEILVQDKEDLIHKAVGWMLREVGKRDLTALKQFLKTHHQRMPRTMLRYAIEKFPQEERVYFLTKRKKLRDSSRIFAI